METKRFRELAARYGFTPTKLRGQHFLCDARIYADVVSSADLTRKDVVLEVGPGFGTLTHELAERAGQVVAVELDRRFEPVLRETIGDVANVDLVWQDVMVRQAHHDSMGVILSSTKDDRKFKIVSNLPYQITSPFLWKFIGPDAPELPDLLVLLLQREVAERIVAKPPRMNLLALLVQSFGDAEIIRRVPPGAFWPPPRVESAVVRIRRSSTVSSDDRRRLLTLAKAGFTHPRRKLAPQLNRVVSNPLALFSHCTIDENARAEQLSLKQWLCISRGRSPAKDHV